MLTYPAITAFTAGAIIIIQMVLMMYAASGRGKHRQGLGDGGNADMLKRIRMHGNLIENAPVILIVMALLEMGGAGRTLMVIFGAVFVIARIMHPLGLLRSSGTTPLRFIGASLTMLLGLAGGVYLIIIALPQV
ncbi:MAG: MAPEG family protein [Rhodobacteraceae bacterium]|nr:MAPEG family protein [Paracoccaceae bacterium]